MTSVGMGAERVQVVRWMEEGRSVLENVHKILSECDQLKGMAEAAQKECARLQSECEQLRTEISRLTAEGERAQKERAEMAQWFTAMLNQAASRLRIEHPPA
jgi:regulator of replication initiation timing